jgi:Tat protein translocase TatB subunit
MFGMSFGEIIIVALVGIVFVGPKELPKMLRKAGQWASKLRRMALDLRVQSGIDDVLSADGLGADLAEIRKLARGELDGVQRSTRNEPYVAPASTEPVMNEYRAVDEAHLRIREYPRDGADAYGCMGDSMVSDYALLPSALALDPLYLLGDATGVLPDPEPETKSERAEQSQSSEQAAMTDASDDRPTPILTIDEGAVQATPGDNAPLAEGPTVGEA